LKKTKIVVSIIAALLAILIPFVSVVLVAVMLPPQFSETFVGALDDKYDYLHSVEGEKIVVVGGSSVAFGLNSEQLSAYTGMPVVNFGLYAALGTKLMLDLSDSAIGEGDIVVIAPELDPQTMSLYFNSDTTLKALDDDFSMFFDIDVNNWFNMLGAMWKFFTEKWQRYTGEVSKSERPGEIYLSKYINEYGDYESDARVGNIMPMYYDPNTEIDLTKENFADGFDAFSDYLNSYIRSCKSRGASVYFSFCPMNELAVKERDDGTRAEFLAYLEEKIDCEFISDIDDYIMEAGYFYDTNFHLNNSGASVRTIRLARDLISAAGLSGAPLEEEPLEPVLPGSEQHYPLSDANAGDFTYELITEGEYRGYVAITGVASEAAGKRNLTIPVGVLERRIALICSEAFYGADVRSITIPAGHTKLVIEDGAFAGAESLSDIWIEIEDPSVVTPPKQLGRDELQLHVPPKSEYPAHPVWKFSGFNLMFDASVGEDTAVPTFDKEFKGEDENAGFFLYEEITSGYYKGALVIVGLTETGKAQESLTVPLGADGVKVVGMAANALRGTNARTLIVTSDTNLKYFANDAFSGASTLTDLWLYVSSGDAIAPPVSFAGVSSSFRVHVPDGSGFSAHYYWGERQLEFVYDAN